jgi:hypothetical protein
VRIVKKENNYNRIHLNLDKKSYLEFIDKIKKLGKIAENKSSINNLDYSVVINGVKTPDMETGGWSNRCEDFKFVLFLDFDNTLWWQVKTQLEFLIERFNLSPFYVFETESKIDCNGEEYGSYNCMTLTKNNFYKIFEMQSETTCDQAHRNLPMVYRFRCSILRNKPKGNKPAPKFKCIVGDIKKVYNQDISSAHLDFLYLLDKNIPKIKYSNPDGYKSLWLSDYKTASK